MRSRIVSVPLSALFLLGACSASDDAEPLARLDAPSALASGAATLDDGAASLGRAEQAHAKRKGDRRRHRRRHHRPRPPVEPGEACEVAGQVFPDGSAVPSGDSCNSCACNDGEVVCTEVACEPVACTRILEAPDGVCSRFPLDPCISQDPDCNPSGQSCEVAGQVFPDGSPVPSGDSCNGCACNDGLVACTLALCEPVFCAQFIEEPDGVCSRFPLDPCISQDPDCTAAGEPEPRD